MTDRERAAVYAAESNAFDGTDLETVVEFEVLRRIVEAVTSGTWWPGPSVSTRRARRDAASSSARCAAVDGSIEIRLAGPQCTVATVAHELAHALAGPAEGHGARFRVAYLDVVAVVTNLDPLDRRRDLHVAQLTAAFAASGLAIGVRRWPAPPASSWGAIAL